VETDGAREEEEEEKGRMNEGGGIRLDPLFSGRTSCGGGTLGDALGVVWSCESGRDMSGGVDATSTRDVVELEGDI
jgi:hypothetical protein